MKRALTGLLVLCIIFLAGCSFDFLKTSDEELEENTQSVILDSGDSFTIMPTVLGFAAELKAKLSKDEGVKTVTIDNFYPSDSAKLSWQGKVRIETEESKQAQIEYQEDYGDLPIGENPPMPPEPEYNEEDVSGKIDINNLENSHSMLLPLIWPEGSLELEDNAAIFLSQTAYDNLVNNKKTEWRIGYFDGNLITKVKILNEDIKEKVEFVKEMVTQKEEEGDGTLYTIEAASDYDQMSIKLNGDKKKVKTIVATNWFGEYVILANPDYPLILKMTPNPLATSESFDLKSIFGYQITEINF